MYYLIIKLESDLCVSSGESSGNAIDNDICIDSYGLPYIPARRIKGCLRAAAEELMNLGLQCATKKNIEMLFGNQFGQEGILKVMDGNMAGSDSLKETLNEFRKGESEIFQRTAHPSNVVNLFTNTLGQTRMKDGVKVDNTLRITRVLNQYDPLAMADNYGNVLPKMGFKAPIAFCCPGDERPQNEIVELLESSCKALRHIGLNRARGLGNITVALMHENNSKAYGDSEKIQIELENLTCEKEAVIEIPYFISLDAPISISGIDGYETEIPGRSVIGCMAGEYLKTRGADEKFKKLFLDGAVRWSPLTPVVNGNISAPTPMMLMELKNGKKRKLNRYTQTDHHWTSLKPKTLDGTYAVLTSDGYIISSPILQMSFHHSVSRDTLYTQNALKDAMIYGGRVYITNASKELACEVVRLLTTGKIMFGRSKGAQYSSCSFKGFGKIQTANVAIRKVEKNEKFFVVLQTDMVVVDGGMFQTDDNSIRKKIAESLSKAEIRTDLNGNPEHPEGFIDICTYKTISGYNATWQLQKPHIPVVKAGSVYCFISEGGFIPEDITLGEFVQEGLGKCRIFTLDELKQSQNIQKGEIDVAVNDDGENRKAQLKTAMLVYTAKEELQRYGREYEVKDRNIPIARLRLMLSEAKELEELKKSVGSMKTSDISSQNEKGRRKISQDLIDDFYGNEPKELLEKVLNDQPGLYAELEKDPKAMQEVSKMWKLPLEVLLHSMHYEKER